MGDRDIDRRDGNATGGEPINMLFARITLTILLFSVPAVVFGRAASTFKDLANQLVGLLDSATTVLIVAGIGVYFYGVSTNILNFSDKSGEKLKAYFFWGIIVLFVMVSIWGIVGLLQNTLFGDNPFSANTSGNQPSQNSFQSSNLTPQFHE